ncbi:hypothetical protein C8F01DRAFT_1086045 [Mycena amicta]|nr:hypothetical protein C8F01DRAFT_1086045 [Mycena amicta]
MLAAGMASHTLPLVSVLQSGYVWEGERGGGKETLAPDASLIMSGASALANAEVDKEVDDVDSKSQESPLALDDVLRNEVFWYGQHPHPFRQTQDATRRQSVQGATRCRCLAQSTHYQLQDPPRRRDLKTTTRGPSIVDVDGTTYIDVNDYRRLSGFLTCDSFTRRSLFLLATTMPRVVLSTTTSTTCPTPTSGTNEWHQANRCEMAWWGMDESLPTRRIPLYARKRLDNLLGCIAQSSQRQRTRGYTQGDSMIHPGYRRVHPDLWDPRPITSTVVSTSQKRHYCLTAGSESGPRSSEQLRKHQLFLSRSKYPPPKTTRDEDQPSLTTLRPLSNAAIHRRNREKQRVRTFWMTSPSPAESTPAMLREKYVSQTRQRSVFNCECMRQLPATSPSSYIDHNVEMSSERIDRDEISLPKGFKSCPTKRTNPPLSSAVHSSSPTVHEHSPWLLGLCLLTAPLPDLSLVHPQTSDAAEATLKAAPDIFPALLYRTIPQRQHIHPCTKTTHARAPNALSNEREPRPRALFSSAQILSHHTRMPRRYPKHYTMTTSLNLSLPPPHPSLLIGHQVSATRDVTARDVAALVMNRRTDTPNVTQKLPQPNGCTSYRWAAYMVIHRHVMGESVCAKKKNHITPMYAMRKLRCTSVTTSFIPSVALEIVFSRTECRSQRASSQEWPPTALHLHGTSAPSRDSRSSYRQLRDLSPTGHNGDWGLIGGTDNNGHPVAVSEATTWTNTRTITYDLCVVACGTDLCLTCDITNDTPRSTACAEDDYEKRRTMLVLTQSGTFSAQRMSPTSTQTHNGSHD